MSDFLKLRHLPPMGLFMRVFALPTQTRIAHFFPELGNDVLIANPSRPGHFVEETVSVYEGLQFLVIRLD
jgi:hypothetical protein